MKETLDRQIQYNSQIAKAGMDGVFGANVGKTLVEAYGKSLDVLAKALPAAGSDARMSGCELPVIINSGSGNQGMTVSLPGDHLRREAGSGERKAVSGSLYQQSHRPLSEKRYWKTLRLLRGSQRGSGSRSRHDVSDGGRT